MNLQRWRQVDELFQAAVELEPSKRAVFLDEACSGDHELRREVEAMLASDSDGWDYVERPALQMAAALLLDQPQLAPGEIVAHYKIVNAIGRGGMGEVYLAEDERLGRKVALKFLTADFTSDPSRMRRFKQEARATSALNHPNILTIHDIGEFDGQYFIASEFIDGETLRQRLSRQRMAIAEALDIAIQIASALSVAHEAGIVHRDIKPENVMLRRDGYIKVLDFGLAKLTEQPEMATQARIADDANISSGLIMGTVTYMSPEQARGRQVDARSDIFTCGVVLYEMLAGRAPFEGQSASELVAAITTKEPPPLTNAPEEVQRLISRALRKRKEDRYQTIEDFLVDLKRLKEDKAATAGAQTRARKMGGSALSTREAAGISTALTIRYVLSGIKRHKATTALVVASLAVVALGLAVGLSRFSRKLRTSSVGMNITRIPYTDRAVHVAISPNGESIAYAEINSFVKPRGEQSLWVLQLATNNRVQIKPPAAVDHGGLAYSPDGRDIFYVNGFKDDVLYRIPVSGGEPVKVLSDVIGTISFAPGGAQLAFLRALNSQEKALLVANADGSGERVLATRKKPESLGGPAWSPDGALIACTLAKNGEISLVGIDATTGEETRISDQKWQATFSRVVWLPDGSGLIMSARQSGNDQIWHITYPQGQAHKVTSDPNYQYSDLALTADGKNLVALQGAWRSSLWLMPNRDPSAAAPIIVGEHEVYNKVSWAPDGKILYPSNVGTDRDIWTMNGNGTNPKQLTANAGKNILPNASPDGRYIVFSSDRADKGAFDIWRMDIDGSNPVQLTHGSRAGQPVCSPDGRWVVYAHPGPDTTPWQRTIWKVSIDGGTSVQLSDKPSSGAAISPDGTLIACWYALDPATQGAVPPMKIALIPFAGGPPIKIFDAAGFTISGVGWTPDGQGVSYVNNREGVSNIWSQPISGGPPKQITQFTSDLILGFDWSRDGTLVCSRGHNVQDVILISDFR